MSSDPICGHCGKKRSEHFIEDEIYCYQDTNGDLFSSEPSDGEIVSMLEEKFPKLHAILIKEWKTINGHTP